MSELILTEEQAKIVTQSWGPMPVRDPNGKVLGRLEPTLTPEMIAEFKRRAASPGPWFTSEQVQARLQALQKEWDRLSGFDETYMHEFLSRLDATDPGHMRPTGQTA
ncbi:MAG TPA: hypothetical protein VN688_07295 [Gemmataceae bacterium]|nr:hypothetical protein [Gemmataceae bacterium]